MNGRNAIALLVEQRVWIDANGLLPADYTVLASALTGQLREKWRAAFIRAAKHKDILRRCPACATSDMHSYDWHAFSYHEVAAQAVGADFLRKHEPARRGKWFLLWESCEAPGLVMSSAVVTRCEWTRTDVYIFDRTFTWTFVATHEGWFYYAQAHRPISAARQSPTQA